MTPGMPVLLRPPAPRSLPPKQAANQFSADEAQKQREWEENMSNTAFQRQVADMRAAGVNPAMAMNGSGGASTPSSPAPSSVSPQSGMSFNDLMSLIMMPLQRKLITAQAQAGSDQGKAALITANANARKPARTPRTPARMQNACDPAYGCSETRRMQVEIDRARARSQINVNETSPVASPSRRPSSGSSASSCPSSWISRSNMPTPTASAPLRRSARPTPPCRTPATNDRLADYETSLKYTQELLTWYQAEGQKVHCAVHARARVELDNLVKGRCQARRRDASSTGRPSRHAQTVKTYVNVGTDISEPSTRWLNPAQPRRRQQQRPWLDLWCYPRCRVWIRLASRVAHFA